MKKSNEIHKFKLGAFTILGLAIFIFVVYLVGNKQGLFRKTNYLYAKFSYVSGLQQGNNVRYLGVNVGNVKRIILINDTTIVAEMAIDNKTFPFIKKDALANIGSDGIVGSMVVNITPGKGISSNVSSGDTINSFSNVKLDDMLRTLSVTNENIALLSSDLLKITKEITQGKGTIGLLLNDSIMGSDTKESIAQIKKSATQLNQAIGKIFNTIGTIDGMIKDLENDNNVIGILKDTIIPEKVNKIVDDIALAGSELQNTIKNVNIFINNVTEGEGALNHVINNPDLVIQIDSIVHNVNQATKSLNQNMEALKQNFLFRKYFKNLEKEEIKNK